MSENTAAEGHPTPGEIVHLAVWLDMLPVGAVVADRNGDEWRRGRSGWRPGSGELISPTSRKLAAERGPLTVLSVPGQDETAKYVDPRDCPTCGARDRDRCSTATGLDHLDRVRYVQHTTPTPAEPPTTTTEGTTT